MSNPNVEAMCDDLQEEVKRLEEMLGAANREVQLLVDYDQELRRNLGVYLRELLSGLNHAVFLMQAQSELSSRGLTREDCEQEIQKAFNAATSAFRLLENRGVK